MDFIQTVLSLLITLGILVTIHEWGHYWVARRCGVKVLRFSVGFGKPIWMRKGKDGTEYAVASIPLGGYVRMLDEREGPVPDELKSQAFNNKSVYQRIAIVAAGPFVNLIFALFAYWFLFIWGVTVVKPVVGAVTPDSLAEQAGLQPNYEIAEIDGREVLSWEEINLALAARVGETGVLTLRAGEPNSGWLRNYSADLQTWDVDLETTSPLRAFGLSPWQPEVPAVISQISPDGPAYKAGLQEGDRVVSIDDTPIDNWMALVGKVQASYDTDLRFEIVRDEQSEEVIVRPGLRPGSDALVGYIGAGVVVPQWPEDMLRDLSQGPVDALVSAYEKTVQMIGLTLDSIKKMIVGVISVKNLSGPITIAKVAGASASSGLESFISFLAYLSISLGVLNLLPIPMLDGGHLVYYFVELIRGRPVSERTQAFGMRLGMALLFSLMAIAFFNDLARL
ncbi:RIP metalloprotease RseP [Marinobacterium sp. xm-d-530]|uniref:RIP metalloprotease RseP n=1 Tax=Marinobacterium sp. xm-d-530 TaxID=2497747 RepID=UPI001569CF62|nr:RIP metalloprotease RseP [Marinobacterium sp. xm-d-530]NRQ02283.1 Regulator of sigma-E protease RseP [Marinobacterium sp. xm-d-530]